MDLVIQESTQDRSPRKGAVEIKSIKYLGSDAESVYTIDNATNSTNCDFGSLENCHKNKVRISNEAGPVLWTQVIAALCCSFVHLGLGVILAFTGILLPALTNPKSTDIYLNIDQVALFTSINYIGSIGGAISTGFVMAWLGQRVTLLLTLPLGAAVWVLMAYSPTYAWLISARVAIGFCAGSYISTCHNYIAEISHPSIRGRLIAMCDLLRQVGYLLVYVIGSTSLQWRTVALICGLSTLITPFILLIFLPNSPRWLATVNRKDEARASLTFFRGTSYDVEKELSEIILQVDADTKGKNFIQRFEILKTPHILKRFIILCILMFCIHFAGNAVVMSYSIVIFQSTESSVDSYMSTIISCSMRIFGALTYTFIADKVSRKLLLILPLCVTGLSISCLGLYFYLRMFDNVQNLSWLPLVSLSVFLYSTSIYYSVFLLLRAELLPTSIRSIGTGILVVFMTMGIFVVVYLFPYMIQYIGSYFTFWICGISAFILAYTIYVFIPETKDKSLEEIQDMK